MNRKIILYSEGGFQLGLGNIYRSLSLAASIRLKEKDADILFVTTSEEYVRQIIEDKGFPVICLEDQEHVFSWITDFKPALLIIDYLGISRTWVWQARKKGIKVALIGNDSDANQDANLVVNAIVGTDFVNAIRIDEYGTKYLEGPKYLVLRDEFMDKRNRYVYKGDLQTIGLLFGGTDQSNLSCKALRDLIRSNIEANVLLILGAGYKYEKELNAVISKNKRLQINLLHNISNVSDTLLTVDFLITSPGTALFEAFCLGIPALAFFQNESQQHVFGNFFMTMRYDSVADLADKINTVYYHNMDSFREKLKVLEVGMGKSEIIENILNL